MKLTRTEVEHIADLAKINLDESEIEMFQEQLGQLMMEIEQVRNIDCGEDILISPSSNANQYYETVGEFELNKQLLDNAPYRTGNFIEVERVLND